MNLGHISNKQQEDNYKILNDASVSADISNLSKNREDSPFLQILSNSKKESFQSSTSHLANLNNSMDLALSTETQWKPLNSPSRDPYSMEARQADTGSYVNNYPTYEAINSNKESVNLSDEVPNDYPGYKSQESVENIKDSNESIAANEESSVQKENSDNTQTSVQNKSESEKNNAKIDKKEINEELVNKIQEENSDKSWMSMILNSLGIKNSDSMSSEKNSANDLEEKLVGLRTDSNSKKNSSDKLEKESKETISDKNKDASDELKSFEKKILTSSDLLEKLQKSKEANASTKTKSEKTGAESAEASQTEKLNQTQEENLHVSKVKQEKITQSNLNLASKDGDPIDQSEKKLTDERHSLGKNILNPEKDGKNVSDRPERFDFIRETNKWDIQKEKNIQSEKSSVNNQNQKDAIDSIANSQTSSKGESNRDDSQFQQKSDFMKTILTKKSDESNPLADRLSKDEIKDNMNRLVEKAKIQIISQGKSQAEIRMNPQDLGRMILKINVNQEKVEGRILVDSEVVKAALQSDLSGLKDELRSQGLNLLSLTIDVDLGSGSDFGNNKEALKFGEDWVRKSNEEKLEIYEPKTRYVDPNSLLDIVA